MRKENLISWSRNEKKKRKGMSIARVSYSKIDNDDIDWNKNIQFILKINKQIRD